MVPGYYVTGRPWVVKDHFEARPTAAIEDNPDNGLAVSAEDNFVPGRIAGIGGYFGEQAGCIFSSIACSSYKQGCMRKIAVAQHTQAILSYRQASETEVLYHRERS